MQEQYLSLTFWATDMNDQQGVVYSPLRKGGGNWGLKIC